MVLVLTRTDRPINILVLKKFIHIDLLFEQYLYITWIHFFFLLIYHLYTFTLLLWLFLNHLCPRYFAWITSKGGAFNFFMLGLCLTPIGFERFISTFYYWNPNIFKIFQPECKTESFSLSNRNYNSRLSCAEDSSHTAKIFAWALGRQNWPVPEFYFWLLRRKLSIAGEKARFPRSKVWFWCKEDFF